MISVFVYSSDPNDFPNWRWKIDAGINAPADTHPECLDTGTVVYERRSPMPSIILPYNTRAVSLFNDSLPNTEEVAPGHVSGMERFISSLREIIGNCKSVAAFRNDPLCVFIHFGGDIYEDANSNLKATWKQLGKELQDTFICFAISRNLGKCINSSWQQSGIENEGKILMLPSTDREVQIVLEEGCKKWHVELPEPFKRSEVSASYSPLDMDNQVLDTHTRSESGTVTESNASAYPGFDSKVKKEHVKHDSGSHGEPLFKWGLQLIVVSELVGGFILSWKKAANAQSIVSEVFFGLLGLVFLVIPIVVLLRQEMRNSSSNGQGPGKTHCGE